MTEAFDFMERPEPLPEFSTLKFSRRSDTHFDLERFYSGSTVHSQIGLVMITSVPSVSSNVRFGTTQRIQSIKQTPEYGSLDNSQKFVAGIAYQILTITGELGYIQPGEISSVCDFGSGAGGPLIALKRFFNLPPGHLQALEQDPAQARQIIQNGILPSSDVQIGDGLAYLRQGRQKYDLLTAFMLGPDESGVLANALFKEVPRSLSPHGKLLVYSDIGTMPVVRKCCEEQQLPFDWINCFPAQDFPVPTTAVIRFHSVR